MRILVAGIGNIFLGDDAFGIEVARRMTTQQLPEGVRVIDFGIRSYDLAYTLMEDWDHVILVDAAPRGGQPGTIYVIEPDLDSLGAPDLDAHTMNPVSVLRMVQALGGAVKHLMVVGCEPDALEPSDDGQFALSEPVETAVNEAIQAIGEIIEKMSGGAAAAA